MMDRKMKSLPRCGPSLARKLNYLRTLFKAHRTSQTHRSSAAWTSLNLRRLSSWWTTLWIRHQTGKWRAPSKAWTPAVTFCFLLHSAFKVCLFLSVKLIYRIHKLRLKLTLCFRVRCDQNKTCNINITSLIHWNMTSSDHRQICNTFSGDSPYRIPVQISYS